MLWISIVIALLALIIGSITDLKKREVHDYVSYGLMFLAFGSAVIYAIMYSDYTMVVQTAFGFIAGMIIAYAMFYLGQWGGGDSKLIMGLGAVIGLNFLNVFGERNLWFFMLLVNIIFAGAIYGLLWTFYLAIKHKRQFVQSLYSMYNKAGIRSMRRIVLALTIVACIIIVLLVPAQFKLVLLSMVAVIFIVFYMWLFVKVIEESCMIKDMPISKLTEGDWIYDEIRINGKYIAGPKDLGISKEQISLLKKYRAKGKIRKIRVKEGIPFIPVFLIAFIMTLMLYYLRMRINIPFINIF